MKTLTKMVAAVTVFGASSVLACSYVVSNETNLSASAPIEVRDTSGTDVVAPSQVVVNTVHLGLDEGCGAADILSISPAALGEDQVRYAVSFGSTKETAAAAAPTLLMEPSSDGALDVSLGADGKRSEASFSRVELCFALSAVDLAANVGPKSEPWCLNTRTGEGATSKTGCSTAPWLLAPLAVLLSRRRKRVR
jgi:uncharacterized protein (TIGR03382 family)